MKQAHYLEDHATAVALKVLVEFVEANLCQTTGKASATAVIMQSQVAHDPAGQGLGASVVVQNGGRGLSGHQGCLNSTGCT